MPPHSSETKGDPAKPAWKEKIALELLHYWLTVGYLAVFFGAFAWYRRFILDEYRISYFNYGSAIIEALILAKAIWLGDFFGLNRGLEKKPLIYPTLYKATVFSVFVGVFAVVEHLVSGLLHGKGLAGGLNTLWSKGKYELLARCLVTFFTFIPFFGFRELETIFGEGKLRSLFFRTREAV